MFKLKNIDEQLKQEFQKLPLDYWDFKDADTRELTHGLHNYPAVMVYPISRNIISLVKKYQDVETILDPFMGSGTVLVEGKLAGFKSIYGTDLNPLAILLSKVKTTRLNKNELNEITEQFMNKLEESYKNYEKLLDDIYPYIEEKGLDISEKDGWGSDAYNILKEYFHLKNMNLNIPNFTNMGYWYKPHVVLELQIIKNCILEIEDEKFRNFFLVCFSETARYVSNTRNGEFKMFRMKKEKIKDFNPNVKMQFYNFLNRNIEKMNDFSDKCKNECNVNIAFEDTRKLNSVPDNSIDLVITSPPYGDSKTTVAYGQFSRPSLWWLDLEQYMPLEDINQIDNNLLGGQKIKNDFTCELPSETLNKALCKIKEKDLERAKEVYSFYKDLDSCLNAISKKVKINSYQFWVVGNRTVKEVKLLTDRIITELGKQYGLVEAYNIPRNIPNKVMPSRNSPTNECGKTVSTMTNEHILVLRKEK